MAWRDNKGLAIILAILGLAALGYMAMKMQPVPVDKELKCDKCQAIAKTSLPASATFPVKCSKCNAETAYPALKLRCLECKTEEIVPDKKDEKTLESKCAKCGKNLVP